MSAQAKSEASESNSDRQSSLEQLLFQTSLEEFRALKEEQSSFMNAQRQFVLYALVSAGGIIPIIVGLLGSAKPELLVAIMIAIPIVFEAMAFVYLGHQRWVQLIGEYIQNYLRPQLSAFLGQMTSEPNRLSVFEYERFIRINAKTNRVESIILVFAGIGDLILLVLPSIGSLVAAYYISYTTSTPWTVWHQVLLIANIVILLIIIAVTVYLTSRPLRLEERRPRVQPQSGTEKKTAA